MITQDTAAALWGCHREIAVSEKLLADIAETRQQEERYLEKDKYRPELRDVFGRKRGLQLGVPSGQDCHRLLDVSTELGETVIRAHIGNCQAKLVELNERARIELDAVSSRAPSPAS